MDVLKIQGDIYRVKLIIAMPTIKSVLLLIDCLTQTVNLINGEFNPSCDTTTVLFFKCLYQARKVSGHDFVC